MADQPTLLIRSEHFTLRREDDAFGEVWKYERTHLIVRLIQPINAWYEEHFDENYHQRNQGDLLRMLELAYEKGRADKAQEFRTAIGIKP